ncbi:hypothetical protein, partial [Streptomyces lasiicapitis]|uniref:hypothetical protein n=1 Tax=Streptomyces lasiicapitis TaxID=1923961 RepID=UPI0036CD4292
MGGAGIDRAARRHLSVRFRLGEFDPEPGPYDDLAGASSEDIRLSGAVEIDGAAPAPGGGVGE